MIVNVAPLLGQPIGTRAEYRAEEKPIDPHGEHSGLLEIGAESIEAVVGATHTNPGAYFEGSARAVLAQQCARCLRPTSAEVEARFAEQYYATIAVHSGETLAPAPDDAKTIGSDFRVDLTPLLREELILAMPQIMLHSPDCKGLCPVCGEDLNDRPHEHEEAVDERWAKLQQLRDFHADRE